MILETQLRKMHLARDNAAAFTMDKMQAMVERDERQIQSLIRLIEDMLDVSRIRTGKLSIRPNEFDLSRLVTTLVHTFASHISAAQSSINLRAEQPVEAVVTTSSGELRQPIVQKNTETGGWRVISCRCGRKMMTSPRSIACWGYRRWRCRR